MKGLRILSMIIFCSVGLGRLSLAADASPNDTPEVKKYGVSATLARVTFFGGSQSGPETLISDTNYQDTFETGYGLRLEGFYEWTPTLRAILGIVHNQWDGKFFRGGEFPGGAQFDDFSLTGVYIGLKLRFRQNSRLRPFLLGNFGIVRLSSIDVTVSGSEIPYWDSTYRDYFDLGTGIEYRLTDKVALSLDARLELFGKPDSANPPISDATGASAYSITFGIDYKF
jgi:opacity protein-like surface antigen